MRVIKETFSSCYAADPKHVRPLSCPLCFQESNFHSNRSIRSLIIRKHGYQRVIPFERLHLGSQDSPTHLCHLSPRYHQLRCLRMAKPRLLNAKQTCVSHCNGTLSPLLSTQHTMIFTNQPQASITLLPLAYFLLTTGPVSLTKFWSPWLQISLDALFIILWIVAAGLSSYDCDGLCSSCSAGGQAVDQGYGFDVWAGSLVCYCVFPYDTILVDSASKLFRRAVPRPGSGSSGIVKTAEKAASIAAKQGLDGTMM